MFDVLASHYTTHDFILVALLVLVGPAWALRQSLSPSKPNGQSQRRGYARNILIISALLGLLVADWWGHARTLQALGLDIPLNVWGRWGLVLDGALIVILVGDFWRITRLPGARLAKYRERFSKEKMFPQTKGNLRLFVLVAFLVGCGWELLYRGFLLWALSPLLGVPGAIVLAALAYALCHRYAGWQRAFGSILSSLAFTVSYALTHSLWWLMLLHTFVALYGACLSYWVTMVGDKPKYQEISHDDIH